MFIPDVFKLHGGFFLYFVDNVDHVIFVKFRDVVILYRHQFHEFLVLKAKGSLHLKGRGSDTALIGRSVFEEDDAWVLKLLSKKLE